MIETNYILKTDLLDLLFDGRNKQYGAYELRKKYNKRMVIAVIVMVICCLLFFLLFAFGSGKSKASGMIIVDTISLAKIETEPKEPEVVPPPPKTVQPQIKTIKLTTPIITNDEIKPEDEVPENEVLDNTKIGKVNQDGLDDPDAIAPPISGNNTGVIEAPKKPHDEGDGIVEHVEIESAYPGGIESWRRFLNKNLHYPQDAVENGIEGTVIVQFIVDKAGIVSDVEAVSGPNELRGEAVRVIKKSGQWTPAIQNGRQVKSYKKQPIVFKLDNTN